MCRDLSPRRQPFIQRLHRSFFIRSSRETTCDTWTSPLRRNTELDQKHACKLRDVKLARGHTFVSSPSLRGSSVIDAGAHRCEFAEIIARNYGARVIALEPNKELPVEHRHPDIALVRAALSDDDGEGMLFLDENPEGSTIIRDGSKNIADLEKVPVTFRSLRSLVSEFNMDQIELLKLDIEGAEFSVIQSIDNELAGIIRQVTVEFHPAAAMREEVSRIKDACAHLAACGFHVFRSSYRGYGDVLFLNSRYFANPGQTFRYLLPYYRKALERGVV